MNTQDTTQWCDYARGLRELSGGERVQAELASSERARRAVRHFERVAELARRDTALAIPEYAVRVAKAAGSLRRRDIRRPVGRSFTVLFDSLRDAVFATGTRDLQPSRHQRVFRSDDYVVDVRVEQETNPNGQVVIGQLLRHREAQPVPRVPVLVLSGGRVVGRDLTSRFGEFQAAGLPDEPLALCLLIGDESCIDIPLGDSVC